ncbi:MAG: L-seryl-tRNA(Sec) selenium transferase [Dehalococcoidia bacterium]
MPSVDRVLADVQVRNAAGELGLPALTQAVRSELAERRAAAADGTSSSLDEIAAAAVRRAYEAFRPNLRPVINATGVILHTNLGRAPLAASAIEAVVAVSRGYSNLEYDLAAGERGTRHVHVERLLCALTGAEAAIAVNNNASALLLVLTALADGRQIPIARGQVVEIGGGFRIPDVMRQGRVELVDIGTTNRVYLRDYADAIGERTAALMRVHSSNFRITGFTEQPSVRELGQLAHERGLLLFDDLGSGCLRETSIFGLTHEPTPQESIEAGADLVLFSGDKLLGGPQAGIVAGRRDLIETLRRHPLARAVRIDKASLAALEATLKHYLKGDAVEQVPVWRMIATPVDAIEARASRWAATLGEIAAVEDARSMIGGGSLPEDSLPSRVLALSGDVEAHSARLRGGEPAVVGRIHNGQLLLDPRTVDPADDELLLAALRAALS